MAFADPTTITIGGTAYTLPRTSSGANSGAYTKDDATIQMVISHTYGKRTRRMLALNTNKITTDPFVPATNLRVGSRVYLVVDSPVAGFSVTELKDQVVALATYVTASSAAQALKLIGGES